jgi:hypothetical protein
MLQTLRPAPLPTPKPTPVDEWKSRTASWQQVEYPTVEEIKHKFRGEGFTIFVNATADGYEAASVNMQPLWPGRLAGPVGSGSTPEQAAFHTWEMFRDNRDDYVGRP